MAEEKRDRFRIPVGEFAKEIREVSVKTGNETIKGEVCDFTQEGLGLFAKGLREGDRVEIGDAKHSLEAINGVTGEVVHVDGELVGVALDTPWE